MKAKLELRKRIVPLLLLSLAISCYDIFYLATVFYVPFRSAFELSNAQMGTLLTMSTLIGPLGNVFSGWLCERISPKVCLVVSVMCTGGLAIWMSAMPGYATLKLIYFLLAIVHFSWSPYVKCIHMLGTVSEQGRLFGISTMIEASIATLLFLTPTLLWGDAIGTRVYFSKIILFFGVLFSLVGLAVAFLFDYKGLAKARGDIKTVKTPLSALAQVVKLPVTRYMAILYFASYTTLGCLTYVSPYLNQVFVIPVAWAAVFSVLMRFGIRAVATPVGGLIRDRIGSTAKCLIYISGLTILAFISLIFIPQASQFTGVAVAVSVLGFFGYMLNVNAANVTLGEMQPPEHLVGMIIGVSTALGSLCNLFVPALCGRLLDRFGGEGYPMVFLGVCLAQLTWLIAGVFLYRRRLIVKQNN